MLQNDRATLLKGRLDQPHNLHFYTLLWLVLSFPQNLKHPFSIFSFQPLNPV